ncbi:FtsX-like permease family protein [Streptomyces sp. NPDC060031]|uniref:FtsX-like permease family protein n=1 Tax=Streptomyces sp. NPDC060031 TaxID=3347043 RepID=UPI0036B57C12
MGLTKYAAQGVTPAGLTRTWDPAVTGGSLAGLGDLTLPHALVAAHVDHPLAANVLVAAEPGTGREQLTDAVRGFPGVRVLSAHDADRARPERQAAGATRRQVRGMLRAEAVSVLLMGTVPGSGIAPAVLTAFSVGMTGPAAPAVMPVAYALVVGVAGLLVLTATALPGRVALRVPPVDVATSKA